MPASAAGVDGPCPKCGETIQAPRFTSVRKVQPAVRLEVEPERPVERARPVSSVPLMAGEELTLADSAAMISKKRANRLRMVFLILILLVVGGSLAVVISKEFADQPKKAGRPGPVQRDEVSAGEEPAPAVPIALEETPGEAKDGLEDPAVGRFIDGAAIHLNEFLRAETLEERLPLMESRHPREVLERSLLASSFLYEKQFESLEYKEVAAEGVKGVIFRVGLGKEPGLLRNHLVVVTERSEGRLKVLADPLLDTFGGLYEDFAKEPVGGDFRFAVVATAFDFCADSRIPDSDSKYTVKISSFPGGLDLGRCYFDRNSPVKTKWEQGRTIYGKGIAATVDLRWNTKDYPYVEMIDVKPLTWGE